jgi:tetratricopeptide (TPR) repeat protein
MATRLVIHDQPVSRHIDSDSVDVSCAVARERLEVGDYDGGVRALSYWWSLGSWPRHSGLANRASAELLLMAGTLSGLIASTKQLPGGQRPAEGLLNGAIALFEQMDETGRASEARIELACCYFWQGLFDLARTVLRSSLDTLPEQQTELRSVALIRLALVEHHAGRLHDALQLLNEASSLVTSERPWIKGRFHLELATTLKDLGLAEGQDTHFHGSLANYQQALTEI